MKIDSQRVDIEGHLLNRMVFDPTDGDPDRVALFYHGQGDYAERYEEVFHVFTGRGIRCLVTELPGHGLSPGRRGHCGDEVFLDRVVRDSLGEIGKRPYGVMGHSMGGLLALRHLVLAGMGEYPVPDFAWLSSPLLKPSQRRKKWEKLLIRVLASLAPRLTISTGVTPQMCRVKTDDQGPTQPAPPPKHQLWHRRVSLQWGAALLEIEKNVHEGVGQISADVPLLFTQGGEDPVCPPENAREFFPLLPNTDKLYHEFPEMLHEPFRGEGSEQLYDVLEAWLDRIE